MKNRLLISKNYFKFEKKYIMDLQIRKLNLIHQLTFLRDESIISKIEKLFTQTKKESYESNLKPMSLEEFYVMIKQAKDDAKAGRVISQEELEKRSKNW